MTNLVEFLLARIEEDEIDANEDHFLACPGSDACICSTLRPYSHQTPTRWLAECRVKRRLIEIAQTSWMDVAASAEVGTPILTALAAPYSGHPEFDADWGLGD